MRSIVHPDDLPESERKLGALLRGEIPSFVNEVRYRRKDGTWIWGRANIYAVPDASGSPRCTIALMRDITAEKEAALAAHQAKQQVDAILSNISAFLWAVDNEGRLLISTGRGLEAVGLNSGEAVGKNAFEINADRPGIVEKIRRALLGETLTYQSQLNGRWLETFISPMHRFSGEVSGAAGFSFDVTEGVEAETERRKWESVFQSALWGDVDRGHR